MILWQAFGDDVLVSAPNEDIAADDSGAVYLFDGATGQLLRTFVSPTPDVSDVFGSASVTVTIIVTPKKAGTLTNTVHVSSIASDPNEANNTDTEQTTVVG